MPERGGGIAAESHVHPAQQRGHRGDGARRRKEGPVSRHVVRGRQPGAALEYSGLTREVQAYVSHVRVLSKLAAPDLCADVRAWASSGFQKLAPGTEAFDRVFMPNWVAAGNLPAALSRFEQGSTGSLARRAQLAGRHIHRLRSSQVAVWGNIMNALELWP